MKAIVCTKYGSPEVLQLKEVPRPEPKDNELLIRIMATAVNSGEIRIRKADPFAVRFFFGLTKPKRNILGVVFSGVIEKKGKDVLSFNLGDEVFGTTGMQFGTYAEYVCLPADGALALKPSVITHEEAATIPFGGTTALSFLRKANIEIGQKVLIYGASGSVGTAAIQLAKYFGAQVTGVCSAANMELVKSLGADHVIDYTSEDFTKRGDLYDVIFDTVGKSPFLGSVKSLKKRGYYLRTVHMTLSAILLGLLTSWTTTKKVIGGGFKEKQEDLLYLKGLIEEGHLKAVVDRTYPFDQIPEAHRYVELGHKKGNVAIYSWLQDHLKTIIEVKAF